MQMMTKIRDHPNTTDLVKSDVVIKHLKIHRNTLTKMIQEGMPYVIIGKRRRFSLIEVDTWLWTKNRYPQA